MKSLADKSKPKMTFDMSKRALSPSHQPVAEAWQFWARVTAATILVTHLGILTGCQSLNPFRSSNQQKMTQRLSQQWTNIGLDALSTGRLSQAKSFFTRATAENPQDQLARVNLARTLRQEKDLGAAIEQMERGVELASNRDPKLIAELGEMQLEAGQLLPAKRQAELALALDHRCAAAWALQGRVYQASGELEIALTNFQRAASLDPDRSDVQVAIAQVYQASGQPLRALSAIEKVLHRYPSDQQPEEVLLAKGEVLMELQQYSAAMDVLQLASQRQNLSSEVLLRLAQAQIKAGQISEARMTLNRGLELDPPAAEFNSVLAQLPTDQGQVAVW